MPVSQDEHALCLDKVRFVGDPVAAVVATTEDAAVAAAAAVAVEYEPLPTIATIEEGLAPVDDDDRIHDRGDGGNVHKKVSLRFGDVEPGFAEAALVLDDLFFYQGSTHLPLEQHAAVAVPEDDDRLTLYSSTQTPHYLHRALAQGVGAAGRAHPRGGDAVRRRLRRQERSLQPRDRRGQGGARARPPGQGHAHPRRGLLLPSRAPPGADAPAHRVRPRRARCARSTCGPRSTAAPTAATAWPAPTTPARSRPRPTASTPTTSTACASSPTSRRADPSAVTARRSRASRSRSSSTRRRQRSASIRSRSAPATWRPPAPSPPTGCGSAPTGSGAASTRW